MISLYNVFCCLKFFYQPIISLYFIRQFIPKIKGLSFFYIFTNRINNAGRNNFIRFRFAFTNFSLQKYIIIIFTEHLGRKTPKGKKISIFVVIFVVACLLSIIIAIAVISSRNSKNSFN